jgi:hypothetical protein
VGSVFRMLTSTATDGAGFSTANQLNGGGFYDLQDVTGGFEPPSGFTPGPQHVSLLFFRNLSSSAVGSCSSDATPCYEVSVPEPATWLLLATGVVGLVALRSGSSRGTRENERRTAASGTR